MLSLTEKQEFSKMIRSLQNEIQTFSKVNASSNAFTLTDRPRYSPKQYASELKLQIQAKKALSKENPDENRTKTPKYLTFVETPKEIRRKREVEKMRKMKEDLDSQIRFKTQRAISELVIAQSIEKKMSNAVANQVEIEKQITEKNKLDQRSELVYAWQQANKAKILKEKLEKLSNNPRHVINGNHGLTINQSLSPIPQSRDLLAELPALPKQLQKQIKRSIEFSKKLRQSHTKSPLRHKSPNKLN